MPEQPERHFDVTVNFSIVSNETEPSLNQRIIDALGTMALNHDVAVSISQRVSDEAERTELDAGDDETIKQLYDVENLESKLTSPLDDQIMNYLKRYNIPTNNGSITRARNIFKKRRLEEVRDILALGSYEVERIQYFGDYASRNTKAVLTSLGFEWYKKPSPRYVAALYATPDKMPVRIIDDRFRYSDHSLAQLAGMDLTQIIGLLDLYGVRPGHIVIWPRSDQEKIKYLTEAATATMERVKKLMTTFDTLESQ